MAVGEGRSDTCVSSCRSAVSASAQAEIWAGSAVIVWWQRGFAGGTTCALWYFHSMTLGFCSGGSGSSHLCLGLAVVKLVLSSLQLWKIFACY